VEDRDILEGRVDAIKREVDGLQVHLMEKTAPWYKQVPLVVSLLVSVLALGFSFWSNNKSEERLDRQDRHAARAELRGLIQRLQALPKENFNASRTYSNDPDARNAFLSLSVTETLVLAQQAVELIEELGGEVSGTEYYATSFAFGSTGQWAEAERLVEEGLELAKDAETKSALLHQAAQARFAAGDPEGGRARYQQALELSYTNEALGASRHAYTEHLWANTELGIGECREAWRHVGESGRYLLEAPATDPLRPQQAATEQRIKDLCGGAARSSPPSRR
jgi:tetratricopeptide (TPR) repeat protein